MSIQNYFKLCTAALGGNAHILSAENNALPANILDNAPHTKQHTKQHTNKMSNTGKIFNSKQFLIRRGEVYMAKENIIGGNITNVNTQRVPQLPENMRGTGLNNVVICIV